MMKMSLKSAMSGIALATAVAIATPAIAAVTVGGQPMFKSKTIVQNAVNSADHTTLVAAVKSRRSHRHAEQQRSLYGLRPGQQRIFGSSERNGRDIA